MKLRRIRVLAREFRLPEGAMLGLSEEQAKRRRPFLSDAKAPEGWDGPSLFMVSMGTVGFKAGEEFSTDHEFVNARERMRVEFLDLDEEPEAIEAADILDLPGVLPPEEPESMADRIRAVLPQLSAEDYGRTGRPKLAKLSEIIGEPVSREELSEALDGLAVSKD